MNLLQKYIKNVSIINSDYGCFAEIYDLNTEDSKFDIKKTISIKSNISQIGRNVSCCSRVLETYVSVFDSHVVKELKSKEYIFVGSTVMDEFAMGSFGRNALYPICKNFYYKEDKKYENIIPGGSSSGAAVSVATDAVNFALASSTGGSIRFPASFNDVIGFKPTFGNVSRHGLIAFANSFDQIGFITKDIFSMKDFFSTINTVDKFDMHTFSEERSEKKELKRKKEKVNLLFLSLESAKTICETEMYEAYERCVEKLLNSSKYNIKFINLDKSFFIKTTEAYFVLSSIEAFSNLLRFSGNRYVEEKETYKFEDLFFKTQDKFGVSVKERMVIGQNFAFREEIKNKFFSHRNYLIKYIANLSKKYNSSVFITPVSPLLPKDKESISFEQHMDYDIFLPLANLTGVCAASVPSLLDKFFSLNITSLERFNDYYVLDLLKELFILLNADDIDKLVNYLPFYTRNEILEKLGEKK